MPDTERLFRLRDAEAADFEAIWRLRNSDDVRVVSRRQHPLERADYERELAEAIEDPLAELLVVEIDGEFGGYVRIAPIGPREAEIGIAIAQSRRRRGLGTSVIAAAADMFRGRHPETSLVALTRPGNDPSERAFAAAGFIVAGDRGEFRVHRDARRDQPNERKTG